MGSYYEEDHELTAKRIKAMHVAVDVLRKVPRDEASENYDEREALKAHYAGDPGVNPVDDEWIEPEGESLNHPSPSSSREAIQANEIVKSILGEDYSPEFQWNVKHFLEKEAAAKKKAEEEDDFDV